MLFAAMLYVPLFMQAVHRCSAFASGLFLILLLVGLIAAAGVCGGVVSRTGHCKAFPIIGAVLAGGGMYLASFITAATPTWLLGALLVVVGAGLGFLVQVAVSRRSAVEIDCAVGVQLPELVLAVDVAQGSRPRAHDE